MPLLPIGYQPKMAGLVDEHGTVIGGTTPDTQIYSWGLGYVTGWVYCCFKEYQLDPVCKGQGSPKKQSFEPICRP